MVKKTTKIVKKVKKVKIVKIIVQDFLIRFSEMMFIFENLIFPIGNISKQRYKMFLL
jgi:hypothetical protein